MQDVEQAALLEQPHAGQPESTGVGSSNIGVQQGHATSQDSRPADLQNNPLRSLGDALQEIRQRFDDILQNGADDQPVQKPADVPEKSQLEYLRPDDEDQNIQALGPAGAEEVARLQDLKLIDDNAEEQPDADDGAPMDGSAPPPPSAPPPQTSSLKAQQTAEALQPGVEDALTHHQIRSQGAPLVSDFDMEDSSTKREHDLEVSVPEDIVEAELRRWQAEGCSSSDTEHLWRLYESLTHDLSYALCEQLRLILEPTLATRLKGDYRTGKRLNMKKIIPYIASEYTKDKIWLRRTRPSQREYQVLLALDDSRSMSESHSVHLAYQTLALVAKALTRLEVGEVGVAKFGADVEVLHGFDGGPFTDAAGARVMGAFGFDQRATDVRSLIEMSLRVLEAARERRAAGSSSAGDLWQLEIIISDGICQDHEALRTLLRKAEEQRVMVVFVVIDSLHSTVDAAVGPTSTNLAQNSILSMTQVAYKNVEGRMELHTQRYLESFPFEYYVVVRNVEALPEVLAGTLKQFFERISDD
jgi:midasin